MTDYPQGRPVTITAGRYAGCEDMTVEDLAAALARITSSLRQQLVEIEKLGKGWDGHGSPRIGREITDRAYSLACRLCVTPSVMSASPMSDGGVMLEWEDETREYSLEVSPK